MCRDEFRKMFRRGSRISSLKTVVLGFALFATPCATLAQRGAGGGHTGGGTAGGEGLSSVGKPSGVDTKDDLKDFHVVMAVQATSQQIVQYAAMMKTTDAANAELKTFIDQFGKAETGASELASGSAAVEQAIETARTENKTFLDGFSDPQKSGLREISKRLIKADADLEQQAKALNVEVENAKSAAAIASTAQSLQRGLTNFQNQQIGLGEEMSIGVGKNGQDSAFNLPPVKSSISFANRPVAITTTGVISKSALEGGQNIFKLALTADLSDLQQNITEVLHTQLDKADRCGERIAILTATLGPSEPASEAFLQLHIERWTCLGREANEMAEGNATFEVKMTPSVGEDGALRLTPEIGRVDAQGLIGEWLLSGSLGETLRDKIADSVLSAVRQGGDFNATLPPAARGNAKLRRAQFQGTGSGKLLVSMDGEIRMSNEQATSLTSELKAGELKATESNEKTSTAPVTVQATVPH
jgi:hypothetical protein